MHPAPIPFLAIRDLATRLQEEQSDYDELMTMAEGKRFVLLGEATHGTQDFYRMHADIARRLIVEHGFDAVAIEGDWPDAWRVNRFVQASGDDAAMDARWFGPMTHTLAMHKQSKCIHLESGMSYNSYDSTKSTRRCSLASQHRPITCWRHCANPCRRLMDNDVNATN